MESITVADDQNLKATELRLGLPGTAAEEYHSEGSAGKRNKRMLSQTSSYDDDEEATIAPRPKAQIVGWPPVRCYRKNFLQEKTSEGEKGSRNYVKVSVDGAPFLRKMDLGLYKGYAELLESMFKLTIGDFSETGGYRKGCCQYEPTYEDKDGDWMLVGDVPWEMFLSTCKRLRIKKQK